MRQGGLKAFLIHARWGLTTPYLGGEWWRMVGAAVDEAKKCGMKVWLYDEYNYPSGIAGFKVSREERFRERYLERDSKGRFSMQIEPFKGSGRYSINYLAPEPTRRFIQLTHEAYKRHLGHEFGKTIQGFFLDEPRFNNALPYDERLPRWFKARHGYDPLPKLALLVEEGEGAGKFRRDWWGLISELYCKNFFKPIHDWCRKNRLELTGHLMAEETLSGSTRFSGHGLAPYKHFSIPGCDHLGRGIGGLAPKIASSMASQHGRDRVSCEAFAGCGWDFGFDEMRAMTNWLFSQGINLIVPHAFFYAAKTKRQRNDWPPSMFFQWKHWPRYPEYAAQVERLSKALSGGRAVCDIALYHPGEGFQARYAANPAFKTGYFEKGPRIENAGARRMEAQFQRLAQRLPQEQLDFEFISRDTLKNLGRYRLLILPLGSDLDSKAEAAVARFRRKGGKVLRLGPSPHTEIRKIRALLGRPDIELKGSPLLKGKVLELDSRIHDPYLHQNLRGLIQSGKGGVWARHYRKPGEDLYFFANMTAKALSFKAALRGRGNAAVELSPLGCRILRFRR